MNDIKNHIEKVEMTFEELLVLQRVIFRLHIEEASPVLTDYSFTITHEETEIFKYLCDKIKNHNPF